MTRRAASIVIPWKRGPAWGTTGPVLVSITVFRVNRIRDLPGAYLAGQRLRWGWSRLAGAVGLRLWARPWDRTSGAVSVWEGEADLRRFIGLPAHVEVVRRYREHAQVRSSSWTVERCVFAEIEREAVRRLQVLGDR
jgi:hypothetical protein